MSFSSSNKLFGSTLMIAGCCIGAGMLGLPVMSAQTGFGPSLIMFFISWMFMALTGLLLLEVNLRFFGEVNMVSMANGIFGKKGAFCAWIGFLFLFYCLMVAYTAGCSALLSDFLMEYFNIQISNILGCSIFAILLAIFIYPGTGVVDNVNRILMLGLIATYLILIVAGIPHINIEYLKHKDWSAAPLVLPAMIISFGYHNLIPSLKTYLNGDEKLLQKTILIGSALPLIVYVLWEWVILGLIPVKGEGGFIEALDKGALATQMLKNAVGSPWVVETAQFFAFFSIITSFLTVAMSFVDFLADGLKRDNKGFQRFLMVLLAIAPPWIFAILYPNGFLNALNYAGAFGAVFLFGILPALMCWKGRYHLNWINDDNYRVKGGKLSLAFVILFAVTVMFFQFWHDFIL